MKNILIVGGAGYIGSHTVKQLQSLSYNCIVFDNLVYGHKEAIKDCHFIHGDLMDQMLLDQVFKSHKIDAVVHFAAYAYVGESVLNPKKYYSNNLVGTLNLLNSMLENDVKKIVFSSTCATYGEPIYTPIDEAHPQNPINPYGSTKLMIEQVLSDYNSAYDLKYIALRYFNVAGCDPDGDIGESHSPETHLIPLVLKTIKGDLSHIEVYGDDYETPDGTCIRDYIHVTDLSLAHCLALKELDQFNGCLNLGTGQGTSVLEVIQAAELITKQKCKTSIKPRRAGDPAKLYASNDKAKEILGWSPQHSSIHEIITTAWAWETNRKF